MDGMEGMDGEGRTEDGNTETIVSKSFSWRAMLSGIEYFKTIRLIRFQVTLKDVWNATGFNFSCTWIDPRIILGLTAPPLAPMKLTFLVLDS